MKRTYLISIVILVSLMLSIQTVNAQKTAYVYSTLILSELPAMQQADASLQSYQQLLQRDGRRKAEKLREDVAAFQKKVERGQLSPLEQGKMAKEFEKRQNELVNLEQEMVGKMAEKKSELLQPIYDAFNKAVKEVANERALDIILDADKVLYEQEHLDVSILVKAKLGI